MAKKRPTARVKHHPAERLYAVTTDFPSAGGKAYALKGIPTPVYKAAAERARAGQRSLRWVILTLLTKYATGDITL